MWEAQAGPAVCQTWVRNHTASLGSLGFRALLSWHLTEWLFVALRVNAQKQHLLQTHPTASARHPGLYATKDLRSLELWANATPWLLHQRVSLHSSRQNNALRWSLGFSFAFPCQSLGKTDLGLTPHLQPWKTGVVFYEKHWEFLFWIFPLNSLNFSLKAMPAIRIEKLWFELKWIQFWWDFLEV